MNEIKNISSRGAIAAQTELRSDLDLFFEASNDLWSRNNPNGKFPLNMAENNLSWNMLRPKIEKILKRNTIPDWVSNYTGTGGSNVFLASVSTFMERFLCKCPINPENLVASAGATAVIELSAWALCNPGDIAVFPAPAYPVYTQDINNKAGVERFDLHTHHSISELSKGSCLSIKHLEKAKREITAQGKKFKLLVITNPDNPTGIIYNLKQLKVIASWCIKNKIHLMVNELYGLSIIDTRDKRIANDYATNLKFQSFAKLIQKFNSPFLHLSYGLSKDFGASGFRVGFLYSLNENLLNAYRNLNAPHMVSNITQHIFAELLSDHRFLRRYIRENQKRLTQSYATVIHTLKKLSIPYVPARGSLFVWVELSRFLSKPTLKEEHKFWLKLYNNTGILLTPGNGFGHSKYGQYRLVHSYLDPKALQAALIELTTFIKSENRK